MNNEDKSKNIKVKKGKRISKIEQEDGKKRYDIEVVTDGEINFPKGGKDNEEVDLKVTIKKVYEKGDGDKGGDGKDGSTEEKNIKVKYDKGNFGSNLVVSNIEGQKAKPKNIHKYYHGPFGTMIVVIAALIIGLITGGVMASRKEEKEEGDL